MKVLVTGATGFVGQQLVRTLKLQGFFVAGVGRRLINIEADTFFLIDEFTPENLSKIHLETFDVVVHLAARVHVMREISNDPLAEFRKINVDGTINLANQAKLAGVKRFVFISSVKVNGESTFSSKPFIESDKPNPQSLYGISKLEAEIGLLEISKHSKMEVVIIRPPLMYGQKVKANFASLIKVIKLGIPLPLGSINNKRSFIYLENLTHFILLCTTHPAASNQVFLVSDGHDLSTTDLIKFCAQALVVRLRLLTAPQKLIEFIAGLLGKKEDIQRLFGNLQVDITKARQLLDWEPPYSVKEGLEKTALSFIKNDKK